MDVKVQSIKEFLPESIYPSPIATEKAETKTSIENALIKAIVIDDKSKLIEQAKEINSITADDSEVILDRKRMSKLLHLCCELDSVNSAEALLNGELTNGRVVPLTNEIDADSGFAPLHTAAENHGFLCIELLLRKRARTDMKTKKPNKSATVGVPGNGSGSGNDISTVRSLLPLELALCSRRYVQKSFNDFEYLLFTSSMLLCIFLFGRSTKLLLLFCFIWKSRFLVSNLTFFFGE